MSQQTNIQVDVKLNPGNHSDNKAILSNNKGFGRSEWMKKYNESRATIKGIQKKSTHTKKVDIISSSEPILVDEKAVEHKGLLQSNFDVVVDASEFTVRRNNKLSKRKSVPFRSPARMIVNVKVPNL